MSGFDDDGGFSEEGSFAAFLAVTRQSHAELDDSNRENVAPHTVPPATLASKLSQTKDLAKTKTKRPVAADVADDDDNDNNGEESISASSSVAATDADAEPWPAPHKRHPESEPVAVDPSFRAELDSLSSSDGHRSSRTVEPAPSVPSVSSAAPKPRPAPAPTPQPPSESATLAGVVARLSALEAATHARGAELARRRLAAAATARGLALREAELRAREGKVYEEESEVAALRAKRARLVARERERSKGGEVQGSDRHALSGFQDGAETGIPAAVAERASLVDALARARQASAELQVRAETLKEQDKVHRESLRRILGRRGDAARLRDLQQQVQQLQQQEQEHEQQQQQHNGEGVHASAPHSAAEAQTRAAQSRLAAAHATLLSAQRRALAAQQRRARSEQALAQARAEEERGAEAARALAGRFEAQNERLEERLRKVNEKLARMGL